MKNSILSKILLHVESFPSLPKTGIKLMDVLNDSNASLDEIEKILNYDPGLTANFLKLANSPYFGIPSKVHSVKQAIALLGTNRLKQIVLATSTSTVMEKTVPGYKLQPGDLWRHSIIASVVAVKLAKLKKVSNPNDIFTSALLHDIGKLVLGRFVEEHFDSINKIVSTGVPFEIAENMILETDHAEIGAQILAQWSFPAYVVNAVRYHHNPDIVHNKDVGIDIVFLANIFCQVTEKNGENLTELNAISPALKERMGFDLEKLESISNQVGNWAEDFAANLGFDQQ